MKTRLMLLAALIAGSTLAGCAVYPAGPYYGAGYGPGPGYPVAVIGPPAVVIRGGYYGGWGRRW
jgi:hypothetical protein